MEESLLTNNGQKDTQKRVSDRLVDLIDIVFGVVIALNVAMLLGSSPLNRLPTFGQLVTLPNLSILVAYAAIVMSWVGYHQMIENNNAYLLINRWGYFRFAVDIIIIFFYTVLLYSIKLMTLYFACFVIIFFLYALGGIIRNKEYNGPRSWHKGSFMFMGAFVLVLVIWISWLVASATCLFLSNLPIAWILVIVVFALNLYYRYKRALRGFTP